MKVDFEQVFYDFALQPETRNGCQVVQLPEGWSEWPHKPFLRTRSEVPPWMRRAVFARDGHRCCFCGAGGPLQIDHIWPVAHGGYAALDNLQTLCGPCNARKSDHLPWCTAPNEWGDECFGDLVLIGDELRCERCATYWNKRALVARCLGVAA